MRVRLETYLRSALPDMNDLCVREFRPIIQGNSNRMAEFKLDWRQGSSTHTRSYILRMPSQESIMDPYDPAREYLLLKALMATQVPVPPVLLLEEDHAILGKPFLIMEKISGETLSFAYHALSAEKKKMLSMEYARTLAAIHATDWRKLGLPSQGLPRDASQFAAAEIERCRARLRKIQGIPRRILEDAVAQLSENLPWRGELALIHGDYNVGNVLFNGDRIVAVLDWEVAGIGDPSLDLGWLYPANALALGLPVDRGDFLTLYRKAGGKQIDNLPFYQSLALVKLTITGIQACLALEHNKRGELNLLQMGFTIPYILNSLCYLVSSGLKALHPKRP